ncbi:uncharacterized protein LOC115439978 [Manduca sexta]|uniref:uncharacterized protein LOC115439978 n=1 Tax=Manduca sexta TaxID=7130 RepID=UPI001183EBE7|nr:uncharacterized protein LOC115439978 [Manduca sexta]
MWMSNVLFLLAPYILVLTGHGAEETDLYYYGLEESERSLPRCSAQQACAAVLQRYWRPRALVRLCRCARRTRCDTPAPAPAARLIALNNRTHLQFCEPVTDWRMCTFNEKPLSIITSSNHMNPDELEEQHHRNIQLTPPTITLNCRCHDPNYWKLNSSSGDTHIYQCASLPLCNTNEFCGNVSFHLYALYQSCVCPKHHICVHNGGVPKMHIDELLYNGNGWEAYCQRVEKDYSYEDY